MIKKLTTIALSLLTVVTASAVGTVKICDVDYTVDTLFHAKVGPGTTQTSLKLNVKDNPTAGTQLMVFYLTVDRTNPYVTFKTAVAGHKMGGSATIESMATSNSTSTSKYFAGCNTDFFVTSGTAANGVSKVGAPVHCCVENGEIIKAIPANSGWPSLYFDAANEPFIDWFTLDQGTLKCGDKTIHINAINHDALGAAGVTIYTPKHYGTTSQADLAGQCAEVVTKIVEGDYLTPGGTVKLEVTAAPTSTGQVAYSGDEYVLAGKGSGKTFIEGLKVGDIVEVNPRFMAEGTSREAFPKELCTGNPRILKDGVTLESEGDRGDASARHPRTGIGYNADKSQFYMMVIDGRSAISCGVHTMQLADMLKYAGATDGVNVDGGGSSTLYTSALGVRNNCSDGHPRAVAAGLYAVANIEAEDSEIAEIRFVDWSMEFPKYGIYTPVFYGYNKYGLLVDQNVQGVTLSCDSKVGEIINDGATFYGTGEGCAALTATYNGCTASIPVNVIAKDNVEYRLQNVLIDNVRQYPVEVQSFVNTSYMPISPKALTWTSADPEVAAISAEGTLTGVKNGTTTINGKLGSFDSNLNVTVEIPTGATMPIVRETPAEGWTLNQIGGTGLAITSEGDGFNLSYTGNGSGRGAYIEMKRNVQVWSLPSKLRVRINPGEATIKEVKMQASNAFGETVLTWSNGANTLPKNEVSTIDFNLSDWCDPNDIGIYPINFIGMRMEMAASTKGNAFNIAIPGFEAVYSDAQGGIATTPASKINVYPNPVKEGGYVTVNTVENAKVEVFALNGAKVAEIASNGVCQIPTNGMKGIYVVKVATDNTVKTAKLIVK